MPVIGVRELSRQTADVLKELQSSGESVVITKQGKPIATLSAVDESEVQNLVLSLAPSIREISSTAEVDFTPTQTRSLEEVSEQLAEEASRSAEGQQAMRQARRVRAKRRAARTMKTKPMSSKKRKSARYVRSSRQSRQTAR